MSMRHSNRMCYVSAGSILLPYIEAGTPLYVNFSDIYCSVKPLYFLSYIIELFNFFQNAFFRQHNLTTTDSAAKYKR